MNTPDWIALFANWSRAASERLNPVRERWSTVKSTAAMQTSRRTSIESQTVSSGLKLVIAGRLWPVYEWLGLGTEIPKRYSLFQ